MNIIPPEATVTALVNFLYAVITIWLIREIVRWKQHYCHLIQDAKIMNHNGHSKKYAAFIKTVSRERKKWS
jgi:hypothetical protein